MEAPIEGLDVFDGFRCTFVQCAFAVRSHKTAITHLSTHDSRPPNDCRVPSKVQRIFVQGRHSSFFPVNNQLVHAEPGSVYEIAVNEVLPNLPAAVINPVTSKHHLPPLLIMTGWVSHFAPYTEDPARRPSS